MLLLPWRGVRLRSCSEGHDAVFRKASYNDMYDGPYTDLCRDLLDPLT